MNPYHIALIGGDRRIACMAPIFLREGCKVTCFATSEAPGGLFSPSLKEAIAGAGSIIGGVPFVKNDFLFTEDREQISLTQLQRCLRKHQKIFAGVIPEDFRRHCEEREIACHDFMKDEPLTLFHAIATAEGAVLEALRGKDTLLHQSNCLVMGYGRCGNLIADRLSGLRAKVSVTTRDATELAKAGTRGYTSFPLGRLSREIPKFDIIFNTVPACLLTEKVLKQVSPDSLIIDIASGQKGADYQAARDLPVHLHYCPGLPGKYAAESCAEKLVQYVLKSL